MVNTLSLVLDEQTKDAEVSEIVKGNTMTIESLIDDYQGLVFNTCLNFLNIREDAEEVAQDVFVEVYKSLSNFRGDAQVKTWIYRISISKCLEFVRKQKRKKRFAQLLSIDDKANEYLTADNFDHPGIDEEDRSKALKVLKEVERLAENQKVAFTMYHTEGLSYKEISDIMEISLSAVESLIFRAKQNLKKRLVNN